MMKPNRVIASTNDYLDKGNCTGAGFVGRRGSDSIGPRVACGTRRLTMLTLNFTGAQVLGAQTLEARPAGCFFRRAHQPNRTRRVDCAAISSCGNR